MQAHTHNKVAIITGSSKRIGKHIAIFLAKLGWRIVIHFNKSEKEAFELKAEIDKYSSSMLISFDMSHSNDYTALLSEINKTIGKPSLLINNASSFNKDNIEDASLEEIEKQIRVNCNSVIMLSQAFYNNNLDDHLNIINFNDSVADKVHETFFSYFMSKNLLSYASKIMASQFAPRCRVNSLNFGFVIADNHVTLERYNEFVEKTPLKKKVDLNDICTAIEFLINSKTVTGAEINIDSGKSLRLQTTR